jgi:hypothetical protein
MCITPLISYGNVLGAKGEVLQKYTVGSGTQLLISRLTGHVGTGTGARPVEVFQGATYPRAIIVA